MADFSLVTSSPPTLNDVGEPVAVGSVAATAFTIISTLQGSSFASGITGSVANRLGMITTASRPLTGQQWPRFFPTL